MNNKYVKLHSILRMLGALLAIIVFISLFITKMAVHKEDPSNLFFDFRHGAFFGNYGDDLCDGYVFGFFGYLFVLLGGLAGLAFVFIDELIGKDLTKNVAFVAGGLALAGSLLILLFAPMFIGINDFKYLTTGAGPIVFGIFGVIVGAINIAAPILDDKSK